MTAGGDSTRVGAALLYDSPSCGEHKSPSYASCRYNLVVIGAGSGGLVTAAGSAGVGARVALIENHLMGGDCLNYGCVPSKALIRCARAAHEARCGRVCGGASCLPHAAVLTTDIVMALRVLVTACGNM